MLATASLLVDDLSDRWSRNTQLTAQSLGALVVLLLTVSTLLAAPEWKDERSFAAAKLADHPEQCMSHSDFAAEEIDNNQFDHALELLQFAIAHCPDEPLHKTRAAAALMNLGRTAEAFRQAHEALRQKPGDLEARNILVAELLEHGQLSEAASERLSILDAAPNHASYFAVMRHEVATHPEFAAALHRALDDPRWQKIAPRILPLLASAEPRQ
jgi:predicted Zn-dependent protease